MVDLPWDAGVQWPQATRSGCPAEESASSGTQPPGSGRGGAASLESTAQLSETSNHAGHDDDGERELLRRISCTDRDAFRELYFKYHGRLARFVSRMARHHDDAEEIINDVLLIVWQRAGDFRGASRVSTWIFGIAYRCALTSIRWSKARSRATTLEVDPGETCIEDAARGTEERQLLDFALSSLPPEQRLVLLLAYRMERSCEEIATITGCPVNTVKSRMFQARRKLRTVISAASLPLAVVAPAEGVRGLQEASNSCPAI
jgi:RNA polymerase sigma-70 factor, ECF subfamily